MVALRITVSRLAPREQLHDSKRFPCTPFCTFKLYGGALRITVSGLQHRSSSMARRGSVERPSALSSFMAALRITVSGLAPHEQLHESKRSLALHSRFVVVQVPWYAMCAPKMHGSAKALCALDAPLPARVLSLQSKPCMPHTSSIPGTLASAPSLQRHAFNVLCLQCCHT
ncbi:hypothetical protein CLOP_g9663 [Closterium sp. NIES-67]|nr:hypothetical protein CLOP_g9663 [Closterium sp. NIES-67]